MHPIGVGLGYILQGLAYIEFVIVDAEISSRAAVETVGGRTWVSAPSRNLYLPIRGLRSHVIHAVPCVLGSRGLPYVVLL